MMSITNGNTIKIDGDRNNERKYATVIAGSFLILHYLDIKSEQLIVYYYYN